MEQNFTYSHDIQKGHNSSNKPQNEEKVCGKLSHSHNGTQRQRKTVKLNEREFARIQVENSHNDILLNLFGKARIFFLAYCFEKSFT